MNLDKAKANRADAREVDFNYRISALNPVWQSIGAPDLTLHSATYSERNPLRRLTYRPVGIIFEVSHLGSFHLKTLFLGMGPGTLQKDLRNADAV